jgi:hypothetical protein
LRSSASPPPDAAEPSAPAADAELDLEPEILVPAPREPAEELALPGEAAEDPDDWTAALWSAPGSAFDEPGGDEPGDDELEAPAAAAPGPEGGRRSDLSISDLLAEDLPIPEAEEPALSIRDLLAEDLVVPEREAAPSEDPAPAEVPAETTHEAATVPEVEPSDPSVGESGEGEPPAPPSGESEEATADEPGPDGEPPPERPSRPLPEAAPGRSLGGRLRRAWQAHARES